jgi:hypothetical protein
MDKWTGDKRCKDAMQTLQIFHPYSRLKNLGARCKSGELKKKRASHIRAIDRTIGRIDRKMPIVAPARRERAVAGLGYYSVFL